MDMTRSYKKDIQLLMSILQRQNDIKEASKMLTDDTQQALRCINVDVMKAFRNMIDHTYEKINKKYLKAYIFSMIESNAIIEIKNRIKYCNENAE